MSESVLDYDKIIWEVFAVGVISSVIILYYVKYGNISYPTDKILALMLGFSVLVYSFFLSLGYGSKKKSLLKITKNEEIKSLSKELNNKCYVRTKWMGEAILLLIVAYYFYAFYLIQKSIVTPLVIILIAVILCIIANCCANRNR